MTVTVGVGSSAFLFGALLFLVDILGGGFEVKEVKIPKVNLLGRSVSTVAGAGFICLGLVLTAQENPLSSKEASFKQPVTTVTSATSTTKRDLDLRAVPSQAISVTASSILPPQGVNDYKPENTLDGQQWTAWNEGAPGDGAEESLLYQLDHQRDIERIEIVNGYAKSPQVYSQNARIRLARITTERGSSTVILKDIATWQRLRISKGSTDFLRIQILEVYRGITYHDCAVTEVKLIERL
jgi:hypothetical protein